MAIDGTRAAAYTGAGAVVGGGFGMLGSGSRARAVTLSVTTGVVAGAVQSFVHEKTGSSELAWLSAIGSGAAAGALLLGGIAPQSVTGSMARRGVGAIVGAATGMLAPVIAGIVLAQIRPSGTAGTSGTPPTTTTRP